MLRHALRRLLWTLPTLIGVSIVTFLFLSFVPDPTDDPAVATTLAPSELERLRRERFLDLPRFVNLVPRDVRVRALAAVEQIASDGPEAARSREELTRLGGAALPHVLPALDALAPEPRVRVALALAPIGERMGLAEIADAYNPNRAVAFWTRFWDDRGIEFRSASVRSAALRLARYGSASRAAELRELDTFVLEHVLGALERPYESSSIDRARALTDIAASVTESDDRIRPGDDLEAARACVDRWQKFWSIYRGDYVVFSGASRIAAMATETRYGKWALGAVTLRFGVGNDGVPVLDGLERRAPVTLAIVFGAIALAYAMAVPLGTLSAASRGRRADLVIACSVLGLYAAPIAALAVLFVQSFGVHPARILAPIVLVALGLCAAPTRQQRSAVASALSSDYVRAAIARGASRGHAIVAHALRNALLPVATLAALEAPMALGAAFVAERVFGLSGLGEATLRAVQTRDIAWLMALAIFAAGFAAIGVIVTDLAYVLVDPRLRPAILARKRG